MRVGTLSIVNSLYKLNHKLPKPAFICISIQQGWNPAYQLGVRPAEHCIPSTELHCGKGKGWALRLHFHVVSNIQYFYLPECCYGVLT